MVSTGSGALIWGPQQFDCHAVSSANYTITDTDGYKNILVTTGNSNRTMTLPTASDNTDRPIYIKKVDSGTGNVIIDGEGAETIDGSTTYTLYNQYDSIRLVCDGTTWHILDRKITRLYQKKEMAGTIYSSANDQITFTLVSGKTYRITLHPFYYVRFGSTDDYAMLEVKDNATIIIRGGGRGDQVGGDDNYLTYGPLSVIHTMSSTNLNLDIIMSGGCAVHGGAGYTNIVVEELPEHTSTSSW
jgi:hypothetical protein